MVILFAMLGLTVQANTCKYAPALSYDISNYGEIGDTNRVYTPIIQKAIDDCYQNGGGQVVIPAGLYKTGTLILKDNVELHLASGTNLVSSCNPQDLIAFPPASYRSCQDTGGWVSLIYAEGAQHIAITGQGTIDGRGYGYRGIIQSSWGDCKVRPRNILFISCKDVHIEGITMRNAAMWNQHYLNCEDVIVNGIRVWNHCHGNNDGIDIDGCRRFVLSNSIIDSDDDGIVLKSTGTAACEDVNITGCVVSSFANAIKLGTESTGGYKNILIGNCIVKPSANHGKRIIKSTKSGITAISLEVVDGGIMDGVTIDNILVEGTECALYVRLGNRGRKHFAEAETPKMGVMRNVYINNVIARDVGNFGSSITGIPNGKIENITLSNINITTRGGLQKGSFRKVGDDTNVRHDTTGNLFFDKYWESASQVKEDEKGYPQPTVWGNLPCYGLFVRHVKQISMQNVKFSSESSEPRPAIIMVDVDKK